MLQAHGYLDAMDTALVVIAIVVGVLLVVALLKYLLDR